MDDREKRRILCELGGIAEDVYAALVQELIKQAETINAQMKTALRNADFGTITTLAHSLKGAAGNLRISSIYEIACAIENSIEAPDSEVSLNALFAEMEQQVAYLRTCFL